MHSPGPAPSPSHSGPWSRASRLLAAATGAFLGGSGDARAADTDELRYPATLFVWGRWSIFFACAFLLIYRPEFILFDYVAYTLCLALLAGLNGYVHFRLISGRPVTLRWMLALSATDAVLITAGMVVGGGFGNYVFYLMYYPALAGFAAFFSSNWLVFAWVTMVAAIYAVVSLTVGDGLNFDLKEERALFTRILVMYLVVAFVNLVSNYDRMKRREAMERVEFSRSIHDTVAQSIYVVGLGIETARDLARETGNELAARLDETYTLSRTALWELRHPIDSGCIFEGVSLMEALGSHAYSFTAITSLPVEVSQAGDEPDLPSAVRGQLFGIVHNAMTNVLLHAKASRIEVRLDFRADELCLTVTDDGIGTPREGGRWGHGLRNMAASAERMGGRLEVSPGVGGVGTRVTCIVP